MRNSLDGKLLPQRSVAGPYLDRYHTPRMAAVNRITRYGSVRGCESDGSGRRSAQEFSCTRAGIEHQIRGEYGKSFHELLDVRAFLNGHFVFHPAGERDVAKVDALLQDKALFVEEQRLLLAQVVALLNAQISQKLVERLALRGLFGRADGFREGL